MPNKSQTLEEGFNKFVIRNEIGCWDWKGCAPKEPGYGQFRTKMKLVRSHIASWILHFGEIPKGMQVLHKCDNRKCSRPDHLFLGTQKDNMMDAIKKGRHPTMGKGGELNHNASITAELAGEIRNMCQTTKSLKEVAQKFKVTIPIVNAIKRGDTWKGVLFHK